MPRKASLPELKVEHAVALPLAALVRTELLSCRRLREQSQGLAGGAAASSVAPTPPRMSEAPLHSVLLCLRFLFSNPG